MPEKYKRKLLEKKKEEAIIAQQWKHYGQLTNHLDPGWLQPFLAEVEQDGTFALYQIQKTIDHVKTLKLGDYKEDIATKKKSEPVLKARQALLGFLKKSIDKAREEVEQVGNYILRQTEPESETNATKLMMREMKYQEVRMIVRNADPRHRPDLIRGNKLFLEAMIDSPDQLISPDNLIQMRRDYAFSIDPSLELWEKDTKIQHDYIRRRAGEINATAHMMITDSLKIDVDVSPEEFYQAFPPQNDREATIAAQRIQAFNSAKDRAERKAEWEEKNRLGTDLIQEHGQQSMKQAREARK